MVAGAQGANVAGQLAGHAGRSSGAGPSFDTLSAKRSACPICCEHRTGKIDTILNQTSSNLVVNIST